MTKAQAIKQLEIWRECMRADLTEPDVIETYNMAIQTLETVSHLKDRPCEACEYHTERGCSKWDCVFDGVLRG